VNIVGGYRFPAAPAIDLSPVKPASLKSVAPVEITGDGLDIPEFLRRTVATADGARWTMPRGSAWHPRLVKRIVGRLA
jgi:hypothetical protein